MPQESLNIFVRLLGLREFTRQTKRASVAAGLISGRWNIAGRRMSTGTALMYRSIRFIHRNMLGLATIAGVAGFGIVKGFMDFEAQMRRVAAVTTDSIGGVKGGLQTLTKAAIHEASQFSFSNQEAAQSLYILASAGLTAKESMQALHGTMSLAQATSATLQQATYLQTAAINTFGVKARDATKVADLLTVAVNASALEVGDLGYSFKYAAGPAAAAGIGITDLTTAMMVMAQGGIRGQRAGTALRMSIKQLIAPTAAAKGAMASLGLTTKDFLDPKGGLKPLAQIIPMVNQGLKGMKPAAQSAAIAALVGTNAWSGFQTLLQQSPKFWDRFSKKANKAFGNTASEADTAAKLTQKSTKAALENMGNMIQGFFTLVLMKYSPQIQAFLLNIGHWFERLGDKIPAILAFIKPFWLTFVQLWHLAGTIAKDALVVVGAALVAVRAIMPGLAAVLKFVNENWDYFRVLIIGIAGILGALLLVKIAKSVIFWTKFGIAAVKLNIAIIKTIGITRGLALIFATNPLTIWIVALGALVILFILAYKKFSWFRDFVRFVVKAIVKDFWNFVHNIRDSFWSVVHFFQNAWDTIKSVFWAAINFIKDHWMIFAAALFGPIGIAVGLIIAKWDSLKSAFSTVWDGIKTAFGRAWKWIEDHVISPMRDAYNLVKSIVTLGGLFGGGGVPFDKLSKKKQHAITVRLQGVFGQASGGITAMAGISMVGERGPELLTLPRGARVDPLPVGGPDPISLAANGWGGGDIHTHVEIDGREIAHATHRFVQSKAARR